MSELIPQNERSKLLVVEDEPAVLRPIARLLTGYLRSASLGVDVLTKTSSAQAIQILQADTQNLIVFVLTDRDTNDGPTGPNGLDVIELAQKKGIQAALMTADLDPEDPNNPEMSFGKPITPEILQTVVSKVKEIVDSK